MGAIAAFDFGQWVGRYPEFKSVDPVTANAYWTEATLYCVNDGSGPVQDAGQQALLLNMLTAHIAKLYELQEGSKKVSDLVGRVDTASEGSVSVSVAMDKQPGTSVEWWYKQTTYGASYWTATAAFRTMRYHRGPHRIFSPLFAGRGGLF